MLNRPDCRKKEGGQGAAGERDKKQRSCDGRGGAQRPFWRVNEPKKTGARSARACMRGQNTLVYNIHEQDHFKQYKDELKMEQDKLVPRRNKL
jgi:hypothetical protein